MILESTSKIDCRHAQGKLLLGSGVNTEKFEMTSVNQGVKQHRNVGNEMLEVREIIFCDRWSVWTQTLYEKLKNNCCWTEYVWQPLPGKEQLLNASTKKINKQINKKKKKKVCYWYIFPGFLQSMSKNQISPTGHRKNDKRHTRAYEVSQEANQPEGHSYLS